MKKGCFLGVWVLLMGFVHPTFAQQNFAQDLDFIYEQIQENHPGIYYAGDPQFKQRAEQAYQKARTALQTTITDEAALEKNEAIINEFIASFQDVHLAVGWYHQLQQQQLQQNQKPTPVNSGKIGLDATDPKMAWISLPTFVLNKDQEKDLQEIFKQGEAIRNSQVIVLDLRGNMGGNSVYGRQVINFLFGMDYTNQKLSVFYQPLFVDWRASIGNFNYLKETLRKNDTPATRARTDTFLEAFQKSVDQGLPFFRAKEPTANVPPVTLPAPTLPLLVVVMDHSNFSSTLIFIDELKAMTDHLVLVGEESGADTVYGEIRRINLPSGRGLMALPMKIFGGRVRGNNESYKPDFAIDVQDSIRLKEFIRQKFVH